MKPGAIVLWNYVGPFQHLGNDGKGGTEPVRCKVIGEYCPDGWSPQGRAWEVEVIGGEQDGHRFTDLERTFSSESEASAR